MHPGGYPHANAPSGTYGSGNGGGFRYGRAPPYRPPPSPPEQQQQMTPREREHVMMAAGRLAAEFLVDRGDLPPHVLDNRPPAPIPFFQQGPPPLGFRFQGRPPAPPPPQQQHPRPFHFQGQHQHRPPGPQRRFMGPRQFQGGHGPFPKRPLYGPRAPAPPLPTLDKTTTGCAGQGAAPPAEESTMQEYKGDGAVAGEAGDSQSTAQPGGTTSGAPQQMSEPSSSSVGADESKPS